ncbi:MAG: hypothetical protein J5525_00220 [Lachnospiraceae bacterium]|nr:hypothetical protein [Lachnospiraceae bacterium]
MRKYREVLCPVCEKKYMTYVHSDEGYDVTIRQVDKTLYGWADSCPKCNTYLFIEDHVLEGREMDDFDEKDVYHKFALR